MSFGFPLSASSRYFVFLSRNGGRGCDFAVIFFLLFPEKGFGTSWHTVQLFESLRYFRGKISPRDTNSALASATSLSPLAILGKLLPVPTELHLVRSIGDPSRSTWLPPRLPRRLAYRHNPLNRETRLPIPRQPERNHIMKVPLLVSRFYTRGPAADGSDKGRNLTL